MRTRGLTVVGLSAAILAIGVPASAGGGGHGVCPAFATGDAAGIELRDSCMAPVSAMAEAGGTITVTNTGSLRHTYTALDGSFDSGIIAPGDSVTLELPDRPGTLPVHCTLHTDGAGGGMAGTLTLEALAATPVSATGSGSAASSGLALAGGFVLGSATIAAVRRRQDPRGAEEVRP